MVIVKTAKVLVVLFPLLLGLSACQLEMLPRVVAPSSTDEVVTMDNSARAHQVTATSLEQYGNNDVARLLALAFSSWDPLQQQATLPKILLGKTPVNLPFVLEPPAETVLIGSITWQEELGGSIFFTTTLAPQVAVDSFKASLLEQGLEDMDDGWERLDVFASGHNFPPGFAVCNQAKTFVVWVRATLFANEVSSIRFTMDPSGSGGPCQALDTDPNQGMSWEPLPSLIAPVGVVLQEQGGSVGFNSVWHHTELDALLSIVELAALYNHQLIDAGWRQLEQGSQDSAAWSMWTFQDAESDAWTGSFYLFANPISDTRYTAILRADRQTE